MNALPARLQGLLRPAAYPHPVEAVEVIETQLSWVLLTGEPIRFVKVDHGVLHDADGYWTSIQTGSGKPEPMVKYTFPAPNEVVQTKCGPSNNTSMFYCPTDDTIVFSQQLAIEAKNECALGIAQSHGAVRDGVAPLAARRAPGAHGWLPR